MKNKLNKQNFEFRWVQNVVKSDGSNSVEGCKAFVRTMPGAFPETGVEIGSAPEHENTYNVTRMQIYANGEEIICTPEHPFYSPVKGWTDAVHLRAGDILVLVKLTVPIEFLILKRKNENIFVLLN